MPFPIKDFPSKQEIARWKKEDENYQLYNADLVYADDSTDRGKWRLVQFFENDKTKAAILDIALHIAPLAVDAGTDFLFGKPVKIEVAEEKGVEDTKKRIEELRKRMNLGQKLKESATLFQTIGHTQFKVYAEMKDGKRIACVEEVPYDNYSPNWAGVPNGEESKDVRIVSYVTSVDADGVETKYIYVENYYLDDAGKCWCHKSAWEDKSAQLGDPVPLEHIGIKSAGTADPKNPNARIEDTGLTELPIVPLNMRKTVKERYGQSLLKKGLPIINQINDRLTQLNVQFLKHLNAKMQIPEGSVERDSEGKIVAMNLEVLLARAGDPDAKYITNDNPLIEECFVFLEKLIRKFAKLMRRPDSFFIDDEKGGVESVESLRTRFMNFLRDIDNYVSSYDPGVEKLIRLCLKIEGDVNADTVPLKLTFDPGLPKEWEVDGRVWGDAYANKLASQRTAVGRFQGIEGKELDAEMEKIEADEEKMMQSQLDLMAGQEEIAPSTPPGAPPPKKE